MASPTLVDPTSTSPIAVHMNQTLRFVASGPGDWYSRTNGGAWSAVLASNVITFVVTTASSITNRFTFDSFDVAVVTTGSGTPSAPSVTFDVCEGPVAVLNVTSRIRNEALQEPPSHADMLESDDPPLGFPLAMPAANRDGLGTVLLERAYESGGPANLVSLYGPGLFVDTSGKLGQRTPVGRNRGLGIVPSIASYHYAGFYFAYDFGRSRTLSLTRVLYEDAVASTNENVAIVRGDGRRNTYRYFNFNGGITYYTPAALLKNTLVKTSNYFQETTPSGTYFVYNNGAGAAALKGLPKIVVDRYGNPIYYLYDTNNRLQQVMGVPLAGQQGLVPYLGYDSSNRCNVLVPPGQRRPPRTTARRISPTTRTTT